MSIKAHITRGLEITAQIDRLKTELKALETLIEAAALEADHLPLNEPDREGRQAILQGDGVTIPVIFESDLVAGSLPDPGLQLTGIKSAINDDAILSQIWRPSGKLDRVAKDGQTYRRQLRSLLPPDIAARVLLASLIRDKTGIPKSRTIIAWDRVSPIA